MIKLKCDHCGKIWKETKKQRESEIVTCPKCNAFHHRHTPPIKETKPIQVKDDNTPIKRGKPRHMNPAKRVPIIQKNMEGKSVRTETTYRVDPMEKKKK